MNYDEDVIVIGNGPAGLAAAIRARWVKGYAAMPCSVAVVGTGATGGLLPWGGVILSGPSWAYKGEELLEKLTADVRRFAIPVYSGRVAVVRREEPFWVVEGEGFFPRRALSVVIASGMRATNDEAAFYQRGVHITYKGYEYFPKLINEAVADSAGRGLLVIGNEYTELLLPLFREVYERAGGLNFLLDTAADWQPKEPFPGRLIRGRLDSLRANGQNGNGSKRSFHVTAATYDEAVTELDCGSILIDYNAFENRPSPFLPAPKQGENVLFEVERDERGFVMVDRWMATSVPGIFAAGDVTGRYSSTLMALGDGVCAGFSAYRWAFKTKFGHEPRLFAYAPINEVIVPGKSDLPYLPNGCYPRLLSGKQEFISLAKESSIALRGQEPAVLFDGHTTLAQISAQLGCELESFRELIVRACAARLMTVHTVCSEEGNEHGTRAKQNQ